MPRKAKPRPQPLPRPQRAPGPRTVQQYWNRNIGAGRPLNEEEQESRVLMAMPHLEAKISVRTMTSILGLARAPFTGFNALYGKPIDIARTELMRAAIRDGYTHIMFMDSDMVWPTMMIPRLLRMNVPIASGLYFGRTAALPIPHVYEYRYHDDEGRAWYRPMGNQVNEFLRGLPADHPNMATFEPYIIEADAVGFGCTLIRLDILKDIAEPWFSIDAGGGGEDMWFCEQARAAGYRVHVDLGVLCEHELRDVYVGASFYEEEWGTREPDGFDWTDPETPVDVEIGPRGVLRRRKGASMLEPALDREVPA